MFDKIAMLRFTEANPPMSDEALTEDIVIKTDLDQKELNSLIIAIGNVKEHADDDESLSDFDIPDNWDSYGWDEKISVVTEHMAEITGRFETVAFAAVAYADVN